MLRAGTKSVYSISEKRREEEEKKSMRTHTHTYLTIFFSKGVQFEYKLKYVAS